MHTNVEIAITTLVIIEAICIAFGVAGVVMLFKKLVVGVNWISLSLAFGLYPLALIISNGLFWWWPLAAFLIGALISTYLLLGRRWKMI